MFTNYGCKEIAVILNEYYKANNARPNKATIKAIIQGKFMTDDNKFESVMNVFNQLLSITNNGGSAVEYTKNAITIIKAIAVNKIADKAVDKILKKGYSPEVVENTIEELQGIVKSKKFGTEISTEKLIENIMSSDGIEERVPTGIEILDKQLNGGLLKNSVNILIAATGVGKTTFSSIMAIKSAYAGNKVLHIFFEDSVEDIGKKYYAALTGHYTNEFKKGNRTQDLVDELHREDNWNTLKNVMPIRMVNSETTFNDIKNLVVQKEVNGLKPDLIILDYLSSMKHSENNITSVNADECRLMERTMKRFEELANEERIAILICQQTNRKGAQANTKSDREANVQGSYRVLQPCSTTLYLERNKESNDKNMANLFMDKCRGCEPMEWNNIYLNNGTCQVDLSGMKHINNSLQYNDDVIEEIYMTKPY